MSSTKIDDGGAAFPTLRTTESTDGMRYVHQDGGMSLRAWLAGQALIGLLSSDSHPDVVAGHELDHPELRAKAAVTLADALIAELRKEG